jgi:PEP-CTERM motif
MPYRKEKSLMLHLKTLADAGNRATLASILLLSIAALPVSAETIAITNPGFESDVLSCAAGANCSTDDTITAWTGATADPLGFGDPGGVNATGSFGVFKPSAVQYPSGIPGGVNIAYLFGTTYGTSISQVLGTTLSADDTYTLTVSIGRRADNNGGCNGFNAALEAGGVVLNSLVNAGDASCNSLTGGDFTQFALTYSSGDSPAQSGDPLEIVLSGNGSGSSIETAEIDFDNVALSDTLIPGSPAPEPASMALLGSGLLALALLGRHRARPMLNR